MNICLCKMTKALCRAYFQGFSQDPELFVENQPITAYIYAQEKADAYWQRQRDLKREHLAIMLGSEPIGEIIFKNINDVTKECTLSICMKNDSCKNKGYGTAAERLALEYALQQMNMHTVLADALQTNLRSQHVLNKVGFQETSRDEAFIYYRCDRDTWLVPKKD